MSYLENMYLKQRRGMSQGRGMSGGQMMGGGMSGGSMGGGMSGGGMMGGGMSGGGMGGGQCVASTPPTTVQIQPPPFVLSIPGPTLYAPSQPLCIQQHNPCARGGGGGGMGGLGSIGGQSGQGGRKSYFFEEYPSNLMLEPYYY